MAVPWRPKLGIGRRKNKLNRWRELFAQLEHSQNRQFGALPNFFGQSDFRLHIQERVVSFFERVLFHVTALAAKTVLGGPGDERLAGNFFSQSMEHARFG